MKNRTPQPDDWATPDFVYDRLNDVFKFDFDPCPFMHDLDEWDGLKVCWGNSNYVNPPYSQKLKEAFVYSGANEFILGVVSCFVLPASTSTSLYHNVIKPKAYIVDFVEGRIPFIGINTKGQCVNYHLKKEFKDIVDKHEKIMFQGKEIPKYIKNAGQKDNMIVIFDGRFNKVSRFIDFSQILKNDLI